MFLAILFSQVKYCGGYSGEVPPLPIPNRAVKLTRADGTDPPVGRVGRRRSSGARTSKDARAPLLYICVLVVVLACVIRKCRTISALQKHFLHFDGKVFCKTLLLNLLRKTVCELAVPIEVNPLEAWKAKGVYEVLSFLGHLKQKPV